MSRSGRIADADHHVLRSHIRIALSCCGGSFSPVGAHESPWDSVTSMAMDLTDLISSGKYNGTFGSTGPVVKPTMMSFSVPVQGS